MNEATIEEVRYCIRCGTALVIGEHFGRLRPACPACGWIYFADPKVAVVALLCQGNRVLLTRRVNDPQRGRWTFPGGFVDAGEDPRRAVERECLEETGLEVKAEAVLDVLAGQEHVRGAHILIVYHVSLIGGALHPGDDVDRAGFFPLDDLPPLAFSSTRKILDHLSTQYCPPKT